MISYKQPVISIKKFSEKEFNKFSFAARDYRKFLLKNKNTILLRKLLNKTAISGNEIGSENYMEKSKYRFLKTVNITKNFILDESSIEYVKPENIIFPKKNNILIAKDGGGDGLGETCIYPYENKNNFDSVSSGIILLDVKKEKLYYVFGFLKSQHFKDFIDLNTAQGSTIRHSKLISLEYPVPFPTTKNNPKPENVEKIVSVLVQNLIHKEEQIKLKNKQIDEAIEKELHENQKSEKFVYKKSVKISEIFKNEFRIDTMMYEEDFKEKLFLIQNYKKGASTIDDLKFTIRRGQNLQITCIGESYYSDIQKDNFRPLITSKNINFSRQLLSIDYIGNKNNLINIKEGDIMVAATGVNTGKTYIFPEVIKDSISNINSFFINNKNVTLSIFTGLFISYLSNFNFLKKVGSQSNGGSILDKDLKKLLIPNFPESKQKEIAQLYYNKLEKNSGLDLDTYLEKEKSRNEKLGIFQLNMEIFDLREKLENLVYKIVMEEKIEIKF